jgi:hypothetical protein
MISKKTGVVIAATTAAVTESIIWWILTHYVHASHSPGFWFLFHLPGILLAGPLHLPDMAQSIFIAFTGAIQFFILFWLVITFLRYIYGRRHSA